MNNETKFTPGPWSATAPTKASGNGDAGRWKVHSSIQPICGVWNDSQSSNAHLIAAAPDMYEALKAISDFREEMVGGDEEYDGTDARYFITKRWELWDAAIKALAKAEGRQA